MKASELKAKLESGLDMPQVAQLKVRGEGSSFELLIVASLFSGLSKVKRQQLVYAALGDLFSSGALHALTIKTHTHEEWEKLNSVTLSGDMHL